jgi:hypothetical protein
MKIATSDGIGICIKKICADAAMMLHIKLM